jgi:ABC-type bacteriocin/lantibiotic exporter with double-glycine peptidase domain
VLLTIPNVRQAAAHDCGAAAVSAVLQYHGLAPARWLTRLANPVQGMSPDTIEAVLWDALGHVASGTMSVPDLKHFCNTRRPVLCPVTFADGLGHWVVVRGVVRGAVYYHCPTDGPEKMSVAKWEGIWHDSTPGSEYRTFGIMGWPG